MLRLLQFECSKIVKSKYFRLLSVLLLLSVIVYYVYVYINTIQVTDVTPDIRLMVESQEKQIQKELDSLQLTRESEDIPFELQFSIDLLEKENYELVGYENEDWPALLAYEIERMETGLDTLIAKREYYTSSWPTLFTKETFRAQYQWMLDKQIEPVLRLDRYTWRTIYDLFYPSAESHDDELIKDFVLKSSAKYSSTGIYFANHVFTLFFSLFGIFFFILLFSDVVTKEGLGRNGSIQLLQTQPIRWNTIFASKFLVVLLLTVLFIVGICGLSVLLGAAFDQFGEWEYPVLIYGEDYAFKFMGMGIFLLKSASLFFMALLFSYALLFLYSIITKRMIVAVGLTLVTLLLGTQFAGEAIEIEFAPYIPFFYLEAPEIISMKFAATHKNFAFSYSNGMFVLGTYTFILLILTYVFSKIAYKSES